MRLTSLLCLIAALACHAAASDHKALLDPALRDLLHEALSGERAKDHVIEITRSSRVQGSRQYRRSGEYVLEQLRLAGFDEATAFVRWLEMRGRGHRLRRVLPVRRQDPLPDLAVAPGLRHDARRAPRRGTLR